MYHDNKTIPLLGDTQESRQKGIAKTLFFQRNRETFKVSRKLLGWYVSKGSTPPLYQQPYGITFCGARYQPYSFWVKHVPSTESQRLRVLRIESCWHWIHSYGETARVSIMMVPCYCWTKNKFHSSFCRHHLELYRRHSIPMGSLNYPGSHVIGRLARGHSTEDHDS